MISKNLQSLQRLAISFAIGGAIWFIPAPKGVPQEGWQLLAIFVATIVGVIAKPYPMGAVTLIAVTFSILTNTLTTEQAFEGFQSQVVWLVVMAFFIAKGFVVTGFGNRIGYFFTGLLGKKTLGLSYGLALTDLIMAPAVPSVTARSAGIVYPIVQSIARSYDSLPNQPSAKKIGGFLTVTAFQVTVITSAMFMTAMAANPLLAELTEAKGFNISWGTWALAASIPGIISLIVIPIIIYKLYPPKIKETPNASQIAKDNLKEMGKMKIQEWIMCATIVLLITLWIFGKNFGVNTVTAAMVGLSILLITGVLDWKDLLKEKNAWETFFWFCILLMFAKNLNTLGVTTWLSNSSVEMFAGLDWKLAFPILALLYFYSHYFFASGTAHVSSMYLAFFTVALGLGTPGMLAALILIFFSNLFGGITHYSLAPAPLLYGVGYVDIKTWWKLGFICSVVNILIWGTIGTMWWKLLGLW